MTAYKTSSSSCPMDLRKQTLKHGLALIQVALVSTIAVYMIQIKKSFKEQEDKVKTSSVNSVLNGVVAANPQNLCLTSANMDLFNKFQLYKEIVFYSILASLFYNLLYLAFQYKIPTERWVATMVYGPLAATGIVAMALSVDGFLKIRSMTNQPADCHDLTQQFKIFFILSMSMSVTQAVASMWILKELYYVAKKV